MKKLFLSLFILLTTSSLWAPGAQGSNASASKPLMCKFMLSSQCKTESGFDTYVGKGCLSQGSAQIKSKCLRHFCEYQCAKSNANNFQCPTDDKLKKCNQYCPNVQFKNAAVYGLLDQCGVKHIGGVDEGVQARAEYEKSQKDEKYKQRFMGGVSRSSLVSAAVWLFNLEKLAGQCNDLFYVSITKLRQVKLDDFISQVDKLFPLLQNLYGTFEQKEAYRSQNLKIVERAEKTVGKVTAKIANHITLIKALNSKISDLNEFYGKFSSLVPKQDLLDSSEDSDQIYPTHE